MKYGMIGVIGAGVMGVGVAQSLVQTGHCTVLVDVDDAILAKARERIAKNLRLAALFDAELRLQNIAEVAARVEMATDYERLAKVDFVIENCVEDVHVKEEVYSRLDKICHARTIFVANTSAIPIGHLASASKRPDRVIGMHFMNPVPQKKVVEVIRAAQTSDQTLQSSIELLAQMGKRSIVVRDAAGFVSNRVLMLTINEAIRVVEEEIASPSDVDSIFTECLAHKMGPLATADLIGLDTVLLTLNVLFDSFSDDKFQACQLLRKMVDKGDLGRKTGRGFYVYREAEQN